MAGAASLHAVNFAVLRAKAEPDAMLIDCTLPLSPVSAALDLKLGYTIGDALQDAERLDRTLLQSALARHPGSGLRILPLAADPADTVDHLRSEEHTSELQSLMRISYAVFCLKKKKNK